MSESPVEDLSARERQWRETHRRIMAAASAEFERIGVSAARVEHICRAAGVTRPTFYAHFPTKDDVLFELQRAGAARLGTEMSARLAHAATLDQVIDLLSDGLFNMTGLVPPRVRREIQSLFVRKQGISDWEGTKLFEALVQCFRAAEDRGEIAPGHDPAALTRWVLASLFGFLVADPLDLEPSHSEARRFLRVLVLGLRVPRNAPS